MGVVKGFWEVLKPVARLESPETLRGKVLAIDLSFWMIQLLTAVKGVAPLRKPHLRLLFFRTLHLVSKLGAFPVFVTDGEPPPLKLGVRLDRYSRLCGSSVNSKEFPDYNVPRNGVFTENIEECVEMLGLLGLPVLRAKHEAEGLCADLNRCGLVDACVTPDSDAFLYGADCVIKTLQADPKNAYIETYKMGEIESMLGLHREHLVALALLVGCDFDVYGVPGIGCHNAVRLIKPILKHDILDRLHLWGAGQLELQTGSNWLKGELVDEQLERDAVVSKSNYSGKKGPHCSLCGHPGTKKLHSRFSCDQCKLGNPYTYTELGCKPKIRGFRCVCEACTKEETFKKHIKQEGWRLKVCQKIAKTEGFPNNEIIEIFMNSTNQESSGLRDHLMPRSPQLGALETFLWERLHWDNVYVRQKILPLLSYYCLMDLAGKNIIANAGFVKPKGLIDGVYAPHSIQRIKILLAKPLYRLRWGPLTAGTDQEDWLGLRTLLSSQEKKMEDDTLTEMAPTLETESLDSALLFTTDENMALVMEACPNLVRQFELEQKSRRAAKRARGMPSEKGQVSITSFFKAKKGKGILEAENNAVGSRKVWVEQPVLQPFSMAAGTQEKVQEKASKVIVIGEEKAPDKIIIGEDEPVAQWELALQHQMQISSTDGVYYLDTTPPSTCFEDKSMREVPQKPSPGLVKRRLF